MKVTIVGAGNVGTQLAVHCSVKGHRVTIFTSNPQKISKKLAIINENDELLYEGVIEKATAKPEEAFLGAELIFVTMPANVLNIAAEKIEPYVREGMKICIVPGIGGGECVFKKCLEKGAILFGIQRVPSVARLVEYGKVVRAVGYRNEMFVASIPSKEVMTGCNLIEEIFGIKTSPLPNYLNITLTPSNPLLHTTRLKNLYGNYQKNMIYKRVPLFYEEWNDETSLLLLKCDEEVQELCKAIKEFDVSYVKSLKVHYESTTVEAMTKKISGIAGFKGLLSPMVKVDGGYIPDFSSRYFTADFSYGLSILLQIAKFAGLETPNMEETMEWYRGLVGEQNEYQFSDYGITNYEQFVDFYSK